MVVVGRFYRASGALGEQVGDAGLERFDGSDDGNLSYGETPNWGEAKGEAFSEVFASEDVELLRVIRAWPHLSSDKKRAILGMIPE